MRVELHELLSHFSRFLELAHSGQVIVIVKSGQAWARLAPLHVEPKRTAGIFTGELRAPFFEPLPDEELDCWQG